MRIALPWLHIVLVTLTVGLFFWGGWPLNAQEHPTASQKKRVPTFADYRVKEIFTGQPAPLNTRSHRLAREFRATLSDGLRKGANFAGHFTLVNWKCGESCQSFAIVDVKTGRVFPPIASGKQVPTATVGYKFAVDSKLLIVNLIGALDADDAKAYSRNGGSRFYVWENNTLNEVYTLSPAPPQRTK